MKEKDRYEMKKGNLRNKNGESYEIMRFNSVYWNRVSIKDLKDIFFPCAYIKVKYYWVFCINKKKILGRV